MSVRLTRWTQRWSVTVLVLGGIGGCHPPQTLCDICGVPLPDETATRVVTDTNDELRACDPRCALTFQEQTGEAVTLRDVTDFVSGRALPPDDAVYVTGSDVSHGARETLRTSPSEVAERHWHRCLPSVIAFAKSADAQRFQREHGGRVMTFDDLGFRGRPPRSE